MKTSAAVLLKPCLTPNVQQIIDMRNNKITEAEKSHYFFPLVADNEISTLSLLPSCRSYVVADKWEISTLSLLLTCRQFQFPR